MYIGFVILAASVVACGAQIASLPVKLTVAYEFVTVTISFGSLMFASSYVEEEQQFWYWITSSHFLWAGIER
jgi:ethanolamine phosphate transferase 2 subunit G